MAQFEDTTHEGGAESPAPCASETTSPDEFPIDVDRIAATCAEIINAQPDPGGAGGDHPDVGILAGHAGLLLLEVEETVPRMPADRQDVARYVIDAVYGLLRDYEAGERVAYPMAIQCRELLALYQRPGLAPLPAPENST